MTAQFVACFLTLVQWHCIPWISPVSWKKILHNIKIYSIKWHCTCMYWFIDGIIHSLTNRNYVSTNCLKISICCQLYYETSRYNGCQLFVKEQVYVGITCCLFKMTYTCSDWSNQFGWSLFIWIYAKTFSMWWWSFRTVEQKVCFKKVGERSVEVDR